MDGSTNLNPISAEACIGIVKNTFNEYTFWKAGLGLIGCSWGYAYGSGAAILPIFMLVTIDSVTGVMKALKHKDLASGWHKKVLGKFAIYLILLAIAGIFDQEISSLVPGMQNDNYALIVMKSFIVSTECISIIENVGALGVPVPKKFLKYLKDFNSETGEEKRK